MAKLPINTYVSLLSAGYTPEEIREYSENPNIISNPAPDPAPAEAEKPNIISNPAPDPAPAEAEKPNNPQNESEQLLTEMRSLLAMMRNNNINNITMPTETAPDPAQVAACILAPQNKKEG